MQNQRDFQAIREERATGGGGGNMQQYTIRDDVPGFVHNPERPHIRE
jgi:hypothetical protein